MKKIKLLYFSQERMILFLRVVEVKRSHDFHIIGLGGLSDISSCATGLSNPVLSNHVYVFETNI